MLNVTLICRIELEDFLNIMVVNVYSPEAGPDTLLKSFSFQKHKFSVNLIIRFELSPLNNFVIINFPIQTHWQPNLTLP